MPKHLTEKDLVVSSSQPISPKQDCIWINTDSGLIQVFLNNQWVHLGYYNTLEVDSKIADLNISLNKLYSNKVDKVPGKVLSSNNFTTILKKKLDGIEDGANKYIHPNGDGYLHMTTDQKTRWIENDTNIENLNRTKGDDVKLENSHLNLYSNGRLISSVDIPYLSDIHNINTKIESFKKEFLDEAFTDFGFGYMLECTNTLEGVVKNVIVRGIEETEYEQNVYTITSSNADSSITQTYEVMLDKSLRKKGNVYDTIQLVDDRYCAVYRVDKPTDEPEIIELGRDIDLSLKNIKTFNKFTRISVESLHSQSEIKARVASTLITNILNMFVSVQGFDEQLRLLEFAAMTMSLNLKDIEDKIDNIVGGNENGE